MKRPISSSFARSRCRVLVGLPLLLAIMLGGGTAKGLWTDAVVCAAAALTAAVVLSDWRLDRPDWRVLLLVLGSVGACGLQVLPLPVWTLTSGSVALLPALALPDTAGPWQILTTGLDRTIDGLCLLAAVGLYCLAGCRFEKSALLSLLPLLLFALLVQLALAGLQYSMHGWPAQLWFLPVEVKAGLFANENHLATLVICILPLLITRLQMAGMHLTAWLFVALVGTMLLSIGSRAGIVLGVGTLTVYCLSVAVRRMPMVLRVALTSLMVLVAFAFVPFTSLAEDMAATGRWDYARTTLAAIHENWLFGVGYGNFDLIYQMHQPIDQIERRYVQHAHNDYLEILLEGGVVAFALLASFLVLTVHRWRQIRADKMRCAALLSIGLLLAHSLVDYPLRCMALALLFAYLNAIVWAPADTEAAVPSSAG